MEEKPAAEYGVVTAESRLEVKHTEESRNNPQQ